MIRPSATHSYSGIHVQFGLKTSVQISDVFSVFEYKDETFHQLSLDLLNSGQFDQDFANLYKYYKETKFVKFSQIGPYYSWSFALAKTSRT